MVDLYGRQIQREGVNAIRNSLNVGQQASETQQAVPVTGQPVTPQSAGTLPLIDTSDALGSLATLLGPTPAEREARLRRMQQDKAKMAAWTGLFDGLARLGNLYYATKGAAPQQLGNPYEQVEKTAQHASQLADDMDTYRRQYTQQLYALRRQAGEDRRKNMLTEAQANYYNAGEASRRSKIETDAMLAEAKAGYQRSMQSKNEEMAAYYKAKTEALEQGLPYDLAVKKANEAKAYAAAHLSNVKASNEAEGTTTTTTKDGVTQTVVKTPKRNHGRRKNQNTSNQKISTGVNWKNVKK